MCFFVLKKCLIKSSQLRKPLMPFETSLMPELALLVPYKTSMVPYRARVVPELNMLLQGGVS